jgi:hypothetical protein
MTVIKAYRQGAKAGCPRLGKSSAKSESEKAMPSSSRIARYNLPFGKAARATRTVSSGICSIIEGFKDIGATPFVEIAPLYLERQNEK